MEKENKHKTRLFIQPFSVRITFWFIFILAVFILILGNIMWWDSEKLAMSIAFDILFGLVALFAIFMVCRLFEIAYLDEEGISIRCLFFRIKYIRWCDVEFLTCKSLPTLESRGTAVKKDWIVIYTDWGEDETSGGVNLRKKGPWQIYASKKNEDIVYEFWNDYNEKAKKQGILTKDEFLRRIDGYKDFSFWYKKEEYGVEFSNKWICVYKIVDEREVGIGSFYDYKDLMKNCKIDEKFLRNMLKEITLD